MSAAFRFVMAGLVPAIHATTAAQRKAMDAWDKPGHDEWQMQIAAP